MNIIFDSRMRLTREIAVSPSEPSFDDARGKCTNAVPEAEQRPLTSKEVEMELELELR